MPEEQLIELEGRVVQVLPGTMFRVELPNKHVVLGRISGKLRKNFIKIIAGDWVRVEMDPSDITQARIVYRLRNNEAAALRPARPGGGGNRGGRRR
jgi:translation initiation factor IF-1